MTSRLNIIVTAGPTRESLDPARFISNRSTGEMGFALAKAALRRGHKVILVSGPAILTPPEGAEYFSVRTARQMLRQVLNKYAKADAVIMSAAVSDYRPARISRSKIKKSKNILNLKLVKNPDILEALGRRKGGRILVGFALETENLYKNALQKLRKKSLDIIVANKLSKRQNVFGSGKTNVLILDKDGSRRYLGNVTKDRIAAEIVADVERIAMLRGM